MNRLLLMLIFIVIGMVAGEDFEFDGNIQFNKPYLFVSLGCNCWQAQAMRGNKFHGLRDAAYPFDWLWTSDTDLLIKCLDEKFKYFSEASFFIRYNRNNLENTYYNFKFTHDWPYSDEFDSEERYNGQIKFIKNKYARRIARFDSLRHFDGKVFFVRCFQVDPNYKGEPGWNAQNAKNLNDALKRFFPELKFQLVIVSCTDKAVSEIGNIDGIKEYKISDLVGFAAYNTMFMELLAEFMPNI